MNEWNDKVQNIFRTILKADMVEWSVSINNPVTHVHGVIWQANGDRSGELRIKAVVRPEFDNDAGTNSLTRLQARQMEHGRLVGWDTHAQLFDGRFVVEFRYRFTDFDLFINGFEKLVRAEYEEQFTEKLEETLSSP